MISIAAAALLNLSGTTVQETAPPPQDLPGYTYVGGGYEVIDVDGVDEDVSGLFVDGSIDLQDGLFAFGSFEDGSIDLPGGDADLQLLSLGLGYHTPIHERADLVFRGAFLAADAEAFGASDDETGYELAVGPRVMVSDRVEVNGAAKLVDLDDSDVGIDVGTVIGLTGPLHATVDVGYLDDDTTIAIGLRAYL